MMALLAGADHLFAQGCSRLAPGISRGGTIRRGGDRNPAVKSSASHEYCFGCDNDLEWQTPRQAPVPNFGYRTPAGRIWARNLLPVSPNLGFAQAALDLGRELDRDRTPADRPHPARRQAALTQPAGIA
jgi:hypothetical protein